MHFINRFLPIKAKLARILNYFLDHCNYRCRTLSDVNNCIFIYRCNIPVIVMGETGCGKTCLIKFLCSLQCPAGVPMNTMTLMKVNLSQNFTVLRQLLWNFNFCKRANFKKVLIGSENNLICVLALVTMEIVTCLELELI